MNTANSGTGNNQKNYKYETVGFGDVEVKWLTVDFSNSAHWTMCASALNGASIASVPLPGAVWLFATAQAVVAEVPTEKPSRTC